MNTIVSGMVFTYLQNLGYEAGSHERMARRRKALLDIDRNKANGLNERFRRELEAAVSDGSIDEEMASQLRDVWHRLANIDSPENGAE